MKRLIVLAIIMAVMVLVAALVHAQSPPNDLKPTFISPTPGLYVNGWPAFTVSYPKEWVELPPAVPGVVFSAEVSRSDLRSGHLPYLYFCHFNPLPVRRLGQAIDALLGSSSSRTSRFSPTNPPS